MQEAHYYLSFLTRLNGYVLLKVTCREPSTDRFQYVYNGEKIVSTGCAISIQQLQRPTYHDGVSGELFSHIFDIVHKVLGVTVGDIHTDVL